METKKLVAVILGTAGVGYIVWKTYKHLTKREVSPAPQPKPQPIPIPTPFKPQPTPTPTPTPPSQPQPKTSLPKGNIHINANTNGNIVNVKVDVGADSGDTPIDVHGMVQVFDQTQGLHVKTKVWHGIINSLSDKNSFRFSFSVERGHKYRIYAKAVLSNKAGRSSVDTSKTITIPPQEYKIIYTKHLTPCFIYRAIRNTKYNYCYIELINNCNESMGVDVEGPSVQEPGVRYVSPGDTDRINVACEHINDVIVTLSGQQPKPKPKPVSGEEIHIDYVNISTSKGICYVGDTTTITASVHINKVPPKGKCVPIRLELVGESSSGERIHRTGELKLISENAKSYSWNITFNKPGKWRFRVYAIDPSGTKIRSNTDAFIEVKSSSEAPISYKKKHLKICNTTNKYMYVKETRYILVNNKPKKVVDYPAYLAPGKCYETNIMVPYRGNQPAVPPPRLELVESK